MSNLFQEEQTTTEEPVDHISLDAVQMKILSLLEAFNYKISHSPPRVFMNKFPTSEELNNLYEQDTIQYYRTMKSFLLRLQEYYNYWGNFIEGRRLNYLTRRFNMRISNIEELKRDQFEEEILYQIYHFQDN